MGTPVEAEEHQLLRQDTVPLALLEPSQREGTRITTEGEGMRAAIYCRVSGEAQERKGTSLETQLEESEKYCLQHGYVVTHRFSEAESGLTLERPDLTRLRDLMRTGVLDVVVILCLDRLSRDPTQGVILFDEFDKSGVTLEAVQEDIDTSDLGKLISYIRGFASKLEAEKIRERTMRGKARRVKEGYLPTGTGVGILGYDWDKVNKRRVINEAEAKIVARIFKHASSRREPPQGSRYT